MGRPSEFNWDEIRYKYETGQYTMQELADEYGFSARYGYKKSSQENWEKGRSQREMQKKLEEKILDNEAEVRKETRLEYHFIFKQMREIIANEAINNSNEPDKKKINALKSAIDALEKCRNAEWDILMLEQNLQNFSAKYRLEKKEVKEVLVENEDIANSLKELYRKSQGYNDEEVETVIDVTPDEEEIEEETEKKN